MIILDASPTVSAAIRYGTRGGTRLPGPLGTGIWTRWASDPRFRRASHAQEDEHGVAPFYQEVRAELYPDAQILQYGVYTHVRNATYEHLRILDTTLAQVPPQHLEIVADEKPEGIGLSDFVGVAGNPNFTGGLNSRVDWGYTPWDDSKAIMMNYGALWAAVGGVCMAVFHEFGHVMTHHGRLNFSRVDGERWELLLRQPGHSTNPGALEPLCNAYEYMLAAGSNITVVRNKGRQGGIVADARTRRALLGSRAFTMLPEEWRTRYGEIPEPRPPS